MMDVAAICRHAHDEPSGFSEAGCTPQEIRAITGHSIASIEHIIERYCAHADTLASNAVVKLERTRG